MEGLGNLATMPILDLLDPPAPEPIVGPAPKILEIQNVLAKAYGITLADMRGKSRVRKFARPRQIAAALSREMTSASFPQIGRMFGDRDHTTILFAARTIRQRESIDQKFADEMAAHRKAIVDAVKSRSVPVPVPVPPHSGPSLRWAMRNKHLPVEVVA